MREATTFSRILEMKLRFEIGRKLLRSSVDRGGFFWEEAGQETVHVSSCKKQFMSITPNKSWYLEIKHCAHQGSVYIGWGHCYFSIYGCNIVVFEWLRRTQVFCWWHKQLFVSCSGIGELMYESNNVFRKIAKENCIKGDLQEQRFKNI